MKWALDQINWLAVPSAALAAFFLGAIWYTALFGKAWVSANGYTPEQLKSMQSKRPMPVFFGSLVVCYVVAAIALALLVVNLDIRSAVSGMLLGLVAWAIVGAFRMTAQVSSPKPMSAFLIDSGFDFVALLAMGAILGAWR